MRTEQQTRDWLEARHAYWWSVLQVEVPTLKGRQMPRVKFICEAAKASATCGVHDGTCTYNLAYAMTCEPQGAYDDDVAHELCHAAAIMLNPWLRRLRGDNPEQHGELWTFLHNTLLKSCEPETHSYDMIAARAYAKEVRP